MRDEGMERERERERGRRKEKKGKGEGVKEGIRFSIGQAIQQSRDSEH